LEYICIHATRRIIAALFAALFEHGNELADSVKGLSVLTFGVTISIVRMIQLKEHAGK
jgi:hypothetical protein